MGLFVYPRSAAFFPPDGAYRDEHPSYSAYNYLRPGPIAWLKRRRFDVALTLARPWFHRTAALDFGCADGVLLPSLARYFLFAVGIDRDPTACRIATAVVADLQLGNVRVLCTAGAEAPAQIGPRLPAPVAPARGYGILFALETLEHIGPSDATRVETVQALFTALEPDARMIVSVPRMTGMVFFAKYLAQRLTGMADEPLSLRDALRAGLWHDTTRLTQRWQGGHVGFNERTFERALGSVVRIVQRRATPLSLFYVLASSARAITSAL
jgi:hypothetical protein